MTTYLKDYAYFQKLVELKSFSKTAEFFAVSQPTVTYALKRLEAEYGSRLISRTSFTNSLTLTAAGAQTLQHLQRILHEEQLLRQDLHRIKTKKIRMGMPPIITNYLFPKVFDELEQADLIARIEPVVSGSKELLAHLQSGALDLSLLGATNIPEAADLDFIMIRQQPFKLIAAADRQIPRPLTPEFIAQQAFILLDEQSVHQQVFQLFCRKYNILPQVIYQTNDYKLLLDLVRRDQGISFITATALHDTDGVQQLDLPLLDLPQFKIMLGTRHSSAADPDLTTIREIFQRIPFL
ncbi:LysR family transcriptional regulator [Lapidilactobacillus luobeiensis]|uniref:LysR family transcriptional regulator n=1 Tax=Lapidilactobacillus luobeiensis TaxID=2950371 RepID=UPI0021C3FF48|nr:LysR family transcriptional regulator [Lapidilactobacillus luobeiensis]